MKTKATLFALVLFGLLSGTAHAKKIRNVTVKNCTDQVVKLCWFNGKDKVRYFGRKTWLLAANGTATLTGKRNANHARMLVMTDDRNCNEWQIFGKKQFRKVKKGYSFVVKETKAAGQYVRLHRNGSCD